MKIEQIFIAVCVSYFNATSISRASTSSLSRRQRDQDEIEYELINHSDLYKLNDPKISEKCNIYSDHSIDIEYMRYGVQSSQNIMDTRRVESSQLGVDIMQVEYYQRSNSFTDIDCHTIAK